MVKERKAEIATIKEQQGACLHAFHQRQHMRLAVIASIRPVIDAHELAGRRTSNKALIWPASRRVSPSESRRNQGKKRDIWSRVLASAA
jgi:hypothetical protein